MSDITTPPRTTALIPLVAIVFVSFLSVGAPLPALSIHVHDQLGYGSVVVGLTIGLQSITTVLTRHWAGSRCDATGPRRAVLTGLPVAALAGLLYLASATVPAPPGVQLALLLAGRIVLGLGESLFIVGTLSWGIGRLGPARTGTVMSWQGIALYAALGLGAPLGLATQHAAGFTGIAVLTMVAPLLGLLVALSQPPTPVAPSATAAVRVPFHRVVGLIWQPGLVIMLATVPYAAMASFLPLYFAARGWAGTGLALLGFAVGYVLVRLFGSHWPDRFGGARVALVSLLVETAGQLLLWLAPDPALALAGAVLTGVGFSLIFPSMGVEATRRVPPEQRGRAVGNFIAFFDLALALTGPVVGVLAGWGGFSTAFAAGTAASAAALLAVSTLMRTPKPS